MAKLSSAMYQFVLVCAALVLLSACEPVEEPLNENFEIRLVPLQERSDDGENIRKGDRFEIAVYSLETGLKDSSAALSNDSQSFESDEYSWSLSSTDQATLEVEEGYDNIITLVDAGEITVVAENSQNKTEITFTVLPALLQSVSISSDETSLILGTTSQLTVTGSFSDDSQSIISEGISWSVAEAEVASVNNQGVLQSLNQGESLVTALVSNTNNAELSNNVTYTITPAAIAEVNLSGLATLPIGRATEILASATFTDGTELDVSETVSWTLDSDEVVSINDSGQVQSLILGNVSISATIDNGYGDLITSNVHDLAVTEKVIDSLRLTPVNSQIKTDPLTVPVEKSEVFTLDAIYSNAEEENVSARDGVNITSSDESIATIVFNQLDENFTITTLALGTSQLTSSLINSIDETIELNETLTVNKPLLVEIEIQATSALYALGLVSTWQATGVFEDGTRDDISSSVIWSTSNSSIAEFNTDNANELTALSLGSTQISASLINDESTNITSNVVDIETKDALLTEVKINIPDENLWLNDVFNVPQGYSTSINVIGVYTNGEEIEESDATWSLTGNDLITVSGTNGYVVTGNTDENGTGELVLNVSVTRDEGVFTSQVNVNVVAPKITSLAISLPEENGLWKGYSQSYIATAVFSDSSTIDVTSNVEWLISDDSTSVIEFAGNNNVSLLLQGQASLIANYTDASYNNQVTSANYSFDIAGALLESIAIQGYLDTDKNGTGDETLNDLAKGQYATFTATGSYSDQSTADLTTSVSWQSSNTSVLTIEQGDDDAGQARAIESSEVQISVTAEVDNAAGTSISSSYALTVIPAVLESINLEPEAFSYGTNVPSGESVQLTVWGIYSDGSYQQIEDENAATWVSSNSDVAVVEGTTGLVDMVAGDNNIVSITATEVISGNSYTDSLLLNRIDPAFKTIRIAPDTSTDPWNVALGSQYQMQAFAVYSDGSEQEITAADGTSWQLVEQSQQTIATINNSDIKGLVTGLLESDTVVDLQVDAENRFDVQISATASVIVGAPVLELIELSPNNSTMIAGDVLTFTATGYTSDDKFLELSDTVTWSTDDTSVAEFNQSNAYDLKSKQAGNIEVIASYVPPGQEEISTTTRVTVEAAVLREIELTQTIERFTVSPAPKPLFLTGVQDLLTATGIYSDETTERVNGQVDWSSSNSSVATIDSIGLLTPIKPGEATITASLLVTELGQVRTVYIDYEIEVGEALLEYIELSPLSPATTLGLPLEFSATGFYSDGTSEDLTDTATWRVGRVGDDPASLIGGITSGTNIGGIFTATENGFTPISAEIDDYDGQSVSKQTFVTVSDISSIAVTTNEVNFFAGQSADFIATGMTESGDEVTFTQGLDWQISGAGGALVDAGEASSNASIQSSASGSMDIDVTWTKPDTTTVTGSLTVNVGSELLSALAITSPQTEVANGRDLQLVATGTYSNSVTTNVSSTVTWVSSDESVVTIDSDGLLSTVASGESTITASITNAAGTLLDSNELEITVISPVLDSIALSLGNTSLPKGESVRLVATGTMTDGTNELPTPVTWTSSDTSVATVDNGGTVLMLNTASVGETATITASALESLTSSNPAITESIVVTAATPILSSLAIDSVGGEIARGTSTTLTASGLLSDNTSGLPTTLSWSSNSSQMTIDASTGVVTVPDGATIGSLVTITVTAPEETGSSEMVSNSTIIAVGAPLVDSLSITNGSISVPRGTTQQLTAAVVMSDSSSAPVLTWSSSDTNLASVSSSGLVSIPNGATVGGIATITVQVNKSANSSEIIQDSIFVTVTPATLSALAIDSANGDVPKGTSLSLSVTGTLSDNGSGVPTTVTWTSSDTAVATVTQSGVVTVLNSATVTNTTTITASAESETGSGVNRTATFVVTADDPILSSLSIDQADMTLGFGQTVNLSVTGNLSDSTNGLPTTVTWTSSNDDIATVDAAGLVTVSNSTSIGSQVVITASAPIATGSATTVVDSLAITISQAVLESITLSSTNTSAGVTSISVGTDHQIDVTAVLSNGTSDILTAQTWTSSNIAVATVDNNGLVSVLAGATPAATTIITLSAPEVDGSGTNITGTIEITAGGAVINSIAIDSFNQTVARGTELTLSATATLSDGTTDPAPSSLSWTTLNLRTQQ